MGFFNQSKVGPSQGPKSAEDAMQRLNADIPGAVAQTKYDIPQGIMGNPQAMVMHLINTKQIPQNVLEMIMPKVNRLLGK